MPTGYCSEGKTLIKATGKWITKKKEQAFDYDKIDKKAWALLISFFRFYPDFFLDLIRAKDAQYGLELPQRIMFRVQARYNLTYITGARGITKTFVTVLSKEHDGVFYPREKIRYYAPNQKQSAKLASQAFEAGAQCYPLLANWWTVKNDRADMFYMVTDYGSEFSMYTPRGDSFGSLIGEEIAQEGEEGFDFDKFEADVKKGHRNERLVNGKPDRTRVQLKQNYISNASSRNNKAFSVYRQAALETMLHGGKYEGFCMDISYKSALLCNLRSIAYYKKEKATTSPEVWKREMEVIYGGSSENPMIPDETLARCRKLTCMEDKHCGDPNAIYVVAYDVADEDGKNNAKCGLLVWKFTEFTEVTKRDKYKAQAVWVDSFPPPKTYFQHAVNLKQIWKRYCMDGGQTTYLLVDCQGGHGKSIVEEFMKPTTDGSRPLACLDGYHSELEQPNAIRCLYPMKAGTRGTTDPDGDMVDYIQNECDQGNVEFLIADIPKALQQYKDNHGIKDDGADRHIIHPYKKTEELIGQIKNLQKIASGTTVKEVRKSNRIPRDIWSAGKYGLRIKQKLEEKLQVKNNKSESGWDKLISQFADGQMPIPQPTARQGDRSRLIGLRQPNTRR